MFLYGTLLDPGLLAKLAGRPVSLTAATLRGWRRVATMCGHYPTLRRARGSVQGAVATVNHSTLTGLSAYEGSAYRLTPVVVSVGGKSSRAALAWVAPNGTLRDWP